MFATSRLLAAAKRLARTGRRPALVVPPRFNRNSATVSALMPAEQAGLWLLERMRQHLGIDGYANRRVLDFGCGVRFSQAIVNTGFAIGRYAGIDNCHELIDFLDAEVRDPRLSYHFLDARHALYNPAGAPLTEATRLPVPDAAFDVVCMFSVITHQYGEVRTDPEPGCRARLRWVFVHTWSVRSSATLRRFSVSQRLRSASPPRSEQQKTV